MAPTDLENVAKLPLGARFLEALEAQEANCLVETRSQLDHLGKTAPKTVEHLGTVLSILDKVGSCFWGCTGGDHVAEFIGARCCSTARASWRLLQHGYYDESLSLTRSLAEAANLLFLFAADPKVFSDWKASDEQNRKKSFQPIKVRLALEKLGGIVACDSERYSRYCEIATHITPLVNPQSHGPGSRTTMGGHYQARGALTALNELAGMLGCCAAGVGRLVELPPEIKALLKAAAVELLQNTGGVSVLAAAKGYDAQNL